MYHNNPVNHSLDTTHTPTDAARVWLPTPATGNSKCEIEQKSRGRNQAEE